MKQDYDREGHRGEVYGIGAVNTDTAGGRRAFYEQLGNQRSAGGSILDAYALIGIAALIIFPVGVMALVATLIFVALKRWETLNGRLGFWVAFRKIYLACLGFSGTAIVLLVIIKRFRSPFPVGTFAAVVARYVGIGLSCAVGIIVASWILRRLAVSNDGGWAPSFRAALALLLPACAITAAALLAIFEPRAFG